MSVIIKVIEKIKISNIIKAFDELRNKKSNQKILIE
jgi:hypothetical protein